MNAYRFSIPLKQTLVLKGQPYSTREGVLLERDGQWAEASPLPGFSEETIEDVIASLRGEQPKPPALQFALAELESPLEARLKVPFNHLLLGEPEQILEQAQACSNQTCHAVKVKVGRRALSTDIELVRRVRDILPDHVQLRLDANQAWSFDEACEFVTSLDEVVWEYIEEPLQDADRLEALFDQTGVKYALDESLLTKTPLAHWPNAAALICKPTILGGRETIERLVTTGKPVVFSAAFESGVGIARIMQLASEYSHKVPAGLDTLDWLTADLLVNSPQKRDGWMILDGLGVDTSELESIQL